MIARWAGRGAAAALLAALAVVCFRAYLEPSVLLSILSGLSLCR
jgi:hypothetical protein